MQRVLSWTDAERAATELRARPADRRAALLLTRLPLVPAAVLRRLAGVSGGASVYRSLARLRQSGVVAAIRPSFRPRRTPFLHYLTDLGLAAVGLDQDVDPVDLARRNRLRLADLLLFLAGLPHLMAVYDLLAALAASRSGPPDLLAWERPWRRRYPRLLAKTPGRVELPAYAAFGWAGSAGRYLLLPDLATYPLRAHRGSVSQLLALRRELGGELPPLVIATTDAHRLSAWRELLETTARERGASPLAVYATTWDELRAGSGLPALLGDSPPPPADTLVRHVTVRRLASPSPRGLLPGLVGRPVEPACRTPIARLGDGALLLSSHHRTILDLVGRHPFLPVARLAELLGETPTSVAGKCARLAHLGLLRSVGSPEVDPEIAALRPLELTVLGLRHLAAWQGLRLPTAVRFIGLAGGGPDHPVGSRDKLLGRNVRHTIEADAVFVQLVRDVRAHPSAQPGDGLIEWRSAAACGDRHLRPDGYGILRLGGELYGCFLEYDRGTESTSRYLRKLGAYHDYWESGQLGREYHGAPTILFVTGGPGSERRMAEAVPAARTGRLSVLPVLLTTRTRLAGHPQGLLGPIWREAGSADRRYWPLLIELHGVRP